MRTRCHDPSTPCCVLIEIACVQAHFPAAKTILEPRPRPTFAGNRTVSEMLELIATTPQRFYAMPGPQNPQSRLVLQLALLILGPKCPYR